MTAQAAAIPFRRRGARLSVCLIRRKDSGAWGIPKGMVDPGDTAEETALNEALEEAGLEGVLVGAALGTYVYEKWQGARYTVKVYLMEVQEQLATWEESDLRERHWISWEEAAARLAEHPVCPLLAAADRRLATLRER